AAGSARGGGARGVRGSKATAANSAVANGELCGLMIGGPGTTGLCLPGSSTPPGLIVVSAAGQGCASLPMSVGPPSHHHNHQQQQLFGCCPGGYMPPPSGQSQQLMPPPPPPPPLSAATSHANSPLWTGNGSGGGLVSIANNLTSDGSTSGLSISGNSGGNNSNLHNSTGNMMMMVVSGPGQISMQPTTGLASGYATVGHQVTSSSPILTNSTGGGDLVFLSSSGSGPLFSASTTTTTMAVAASALHATGIDCPQQPPASSMSPASSSSSPALLTSPGSISNSSGNGNGACGAVTGSSNSILPNGVIVQPVSASGSNSCSTAATTTVTATAASTNTCFSQVGVNGLTGPTGCGYSSCSSIISGSTITTSSSLTSGSGLISTAVNPVASGGHLPVASTRISYSGSSSCAGQLSGIPSGYAGPVPASSSYTPVHSG
ncbi:unnamed protein product, partial [Protopolystoma xenopodis]